MFYAGRFGYASDFVLNSNPKDFKLLSPSIAKDQHSVYIGGITIIGFEDPTTVEILTSENSTVTYFKDKINHYKYTELKVEKVDENEVIDYLKQP